jgi:peptidoglycan/LPS O-acetylase OafA/YrhL
VAVTFAHQHRAAAPRPPIHGSWIRIVAVLMAGALSACATAHHRRPRTLAFVGAAAAVVGGGLWVQGERRSGSGTVPDIGLGLVAAGIVAMVVAGGWIAAEVSCQVDPDCEDTEECREIPAPAGGIPYKQCMAR